MTKKTKPGETKILQKDEVMDVVVQEQTPAMIISQAIAQGSDLSQIEKLMELQERYDKNEAKKAYTVAMTQFKADPPRIMKSKQVGFDSRTGGASTSYKHADLAEAAELINKALSEHGLSAAWIPSQDDNLVKVTCTITHQMGHSESCTLQAAPDNTGNKNSIQQVGSSITYLERYTLLALTGLATHDMDDDGIKGGIDFISEDQATELHALINDNKLNADGAYLKKFLVYMKAGSLEEIPVKRFGTAKSAINTAIKAQKKRAE